MNHCLNREFPLKANHMVYAAGGSFPEIYPRDSHEENSESSSEEKLQVNTSRFAWAFYDQGYQPSRQGEGKGSQPHTLTWNQGDFLKLSHSPLLTQAFSSHNFTGGDTVLEQNHIVV